MSSLASFSYASNALECAGALGLFLVGRKRGAVEASLRLKSETNEAQTLLISAQKGRIDLLEQQNSEQQNLLDTMRVRIEYLEELVLHGSSQLVRPGAVPVVRRGGRKNPPADPQVAGDGSVR